MITARLQWFALAMGIVFLGMMIELIRKNRVELKYALLWFFTGVVMILLAAFPGLLDWLAGLIGVYNPVNALFAIILCCGLGLMISYSVIMSGNKKASVRLTQEISLLEKRVRELEERLAREENRAAPEEDKAAPEENRAAPEKDGTAPEEKQK